MNANRLINMVLSVLFRQGMRRLTKGQKPDPNTRRAQQSARTVRRMNKL